MTIKKIKEALNRRIDSTILFAVNRIICLFTKVNDKKVVFLSDVRLVLGGNLECVYNYLDSKKYEKIIEFKNDRRDRRTIKQLLSLAYNLATSKYILLDDQCTSTKDMRLRKNQEIIQLWHGPGAFKKFGLSRVNGNENIKISTSYKRYSKAIVSAEDIRWCYADAFSIDINKIKATGFPRTDIFFNKKYIDAKRRELEKKYPVIKNKKVILFAPTYRGTRVNEATYGFDKLNLDDIYQNFKDDYIFIFKWHPALFSNIERGLCNNYDLEKYGDFYQDFSNYRDINDLLLITDILITDYSSVIFDYLLMNKPIVYFTYDLKEYENGRGLYFPFSEYVYGLIANNSNELIKCIKKEDLCANKRKEFHKKFMSACDGKSTKKTVEWIFK